MKPDVVLPRYPVFVPSKGRASACQTAQFLAADGVPFRLVVEPQERDVYARRFGEDRLLVLPWSGDDETRRAYCRERAIENGGLIAVRNWIKELSIQEGAARHWQLDDNIRYVMRLWRGQRLRCAAGVGLRVTEDLVDRYENVAVAGLNYVMFGLGASKPFVLNCHVYSCSLILNAIPYRWRLAYNDDTDLCLQALAGGWCTLLMNAFLVQKIRTMVVSGGNTDDLYQGDGRLRMANALTRVWPGVVTTQRRFQRPQHVIKDAWQKFDTPLIRRPGVDFSALPAVDEYGLSLVAKGPVKSERLRALLKDQNGSTPEDHA